MDHICYHRLRLLSDEDLDSISHSYDLTPLVKPLKSWCTEAFFIYIATLKRLIHKNQCMCCKLSRVIQEGQIILSILKLLTQFLKPLPKIGVLYTFTLDLVVFTIDRRNKNSSISMELQCLWKIACSLTVTL